ncbi:MAG: acetyl-CoA carboxylase biotin carboxylase subunit [Infirmifilum sp.]|jgi:pyruvate carboxylase subunit A|uniref:acetyl-CoA carboxylase biotin carboxylase subunit n=1 Tax=Infirmifilum TaxID=2856573 RepID=UPI00235801CE
MGEYFDKILIANRGEIAVRIIRTAKELGIKTVAVYSEADENSLHVKLADEKVFIGPSEPRESYLNMEKIIRAASSSGAEAIHPGYGFLSQNPVFAEKVKEAGLTWIGPTPDVLKLAGDKISSRRFFAKAGIPIVPGTLDPVGLEEAEAKAEEIGYPVVVKPSGGGGGIGMFVAFSPEELKEKIAKASRLAKAYFARTEVYLEKYFPRAKHIEVQILGDMHGKVIHLFERECSVQRRFQKVIEEAPSPSITSEEREKLLALAVKAAQSCNYVNAGTFEFLFDLNERRFYLLEVNTRIQVEHPVTEMITGVDIVEQQLAIASGEHLPSSLSDPSFRGHAIEARIYAEDPASDFAPSPGLITRLSLPAGPWIRVDSGVYEGFRVPEFYDPLLMKVIAWGHDRESATRRLKRALGELEIRGLKTNRLFLIRILEDEDFVKGSYTTQILEKRELFKNLEEPVTTTMIQERAETKAEQTSKSISYWRLLARAHV